MPSSRTYDADTTSSRPRSRRIGGWRSRSTSWPWRSDLLACGSASTCRASTRRNSAVGRVMVEGLSVAYRQEGAGEPVVTPTAYLAPFAGRPELRALLWALRSPRFEEFDETTAGLGRLRATPTLTAWANRDLLLPRAEMRRLLRALPTADTRVGDPAGHFLQEDQPQQVAQLAATFLTSTTQPDRHDGDPGHGARTGREITMSTKIDPKRELRQLYRARRAPELVEVPALAFLMIDGHGAPNASPRYQAALQALYGVSYALKFALKRGPLQLDYPVMPLEGLWWVPDMSEFSIEHKSDWDWTMMIMQPAEVTPELAEEAARTVAGKKQLTAATELRLERYTEGASAQILHLGPYADEGPTIERLHAFIEEQGYDKRGKHHEVYLGDPRRSAPERLKTIIRQPIRQR